MENVKKEYIIAFVATAVITFVCLFANHKYERRTVVNCKDSIVVKHDTIFAEKEDDKSIKVKPIPVITKYKVSDLVCIWGKWSGVVTQVGWSETDDRVLIYYVTIYREDGDFDEGSYYDTELELGKCH
jgi:hypothetical protein